jgi:hypothetical protein
LSQALEAEVAALDALEDPQRRRAGRTRLRASLNLSLWALWNSDPAAYEALLGLSILPEDAVITASLASTLWATTAEKAEEVLEVLWSEALLMPGPLSRSRELPGPSYRIHDLIHNLAQELLTAPQANERPKELPGLGLTLKDAHNLLLLTAAQ